MGLSSKKQKSTNKPVYEKEIKGAHAISQNTYNQQQGNATSIANQIGGLVPDLIERYQQGNPTLDSASAYNRDVTDGVYLDAGNPYLQDMIDQTNASVADRTNAAIGVRGQTGGSGHSNIISKALAQNETGLRYQDYDQERARMGQAVGAAPSLVAGEQIPLAAAMAAGESAVNLPWVGANNVARNTAGLLGQYQNTTQKQSGGFLGDLLLAGVGAAGSYFGGA